MPYVHNVRVREDHHVACHSERRTTTGGIITHQNWSTNYPRLVEHVYSWRTGFHSPSDVAPSDTSVFGIKNPRKSGNLVDKLADRKRFYEEVMRAAYPAETASGAQSTNRTSSSDSGHLFSTVKWLRVPIEVEFDWSTFKSGLPNSSYTRINGRAFVSSAVTIGPKVENHAWMSYPYNSSSGSLTTANQRQGTANAFFADSAPERPTAHILTTVVELLRGDIPSLLKNYRRALFDYRSKTRSLRYVGGEYLNIQFGWLPLINEYANMIRVFIGLDRMVYAESNRRHRAWDGPSAASVIQDDAGRPYTSALQTGAGENFQYQSGASNFSTPHTFTIRSKSTVKEDYRFSSRYSALCKPSSRSTGFVERAEEVLRQLGLVDDPTILWELTPWSWLVDWAANIGNSITTAHVLSPLSGRHAVDYAYFTTQLVSALEQEVVAATTATTAWTTREEKFISPTGFFTTTQRVRDRATPFGFGTQLGSLNASQFAILVALGLARSR